MFRILFSTLEEASVAAKDLNNHVKFRFSRMWLRDNNECAIDVLTICESQIKSLQRFSEEHNGILARLSDEIVRQHYCWLCQTSLKYTGASECAECHTHQPPAHQD